MVSAVLLTTMFKCGENCPGSFSSQRGLNQHRSSCTAYRSDHALRLVRLSTTLQLPEKRARISIEVSNDYLFRKDTM